MKVCTSVWRMRTPFQALAEFVAADATTPLLTYYDDTQGASGERVELSRRVLATWVAKAANALQEGLDVEPGSVVQLELPSPHWRLAYWALAIWSVGATLTLDANEGADVLITADPSSEAAEDADEVIAVTLRALAVEFPGGLRSGIMDEAKELASYGDSFTPWDEPDPEDAALVCGGERTSYQDLLPPVSWPGGARVLVTSSTPDAFLGHLLHAVCAGASLVLVRGEPPAAGDPRMSAEGVDHVAAP